MIIHRKGLVLVIVVIAVLTSCQEKAALTPIAETPASMPAPSSKQIGRAEEIIGIWMVTSHPHYRPAFWLLRLDGTYTFSPHRDGGRPSESGRYWFEENTLLIKDDFCPPPGKYTVTKQVDAELSTLSIALKDDNCTARVKILTTAPEIWFSALP
jgi:hypothetical protein